MKWNKHTCFLEWTICAGADDMPYMVSQIDSLEMMIVVDQNKTDGTWYIMIDDYVMEESIDSAIVAQLKAVGYVITETAERCGDPERTHRNDAELMARSFLQEIHSAMTPAEIKSAPQSDPLPLVIIGPGGDYRRGIDAAKVAEEK